MRRNQAGIIGASTWLARELMQWLQKWRFPYEIILFDDIEECGKTVEYQGQYYPIHRFDDERLCSCPLVFDCVGKADELLKQSTQKQWVLRLCGCDKVGKLVLPFLSLQSITSEDRNLRIPTAAFAMFATILLTLKAKHTISSCVLTSLHSVAEVGDEGCKDLLEQLKAYVAGQEPESDIFPLKNAYQHLPLLFQTIPQTSDFCDGGSSEEELRFEKNLKELMDIKLDICATCVRVAGLRGLSMSLAFRSDETLDPQALIDLFSQDPNMICFDDITHNMYPICADVIHDYRIYIGRMRKSDPHTFAMWAVCDDLALRCGIAVKTALYVIHNFIEQE